MLQSISDSLPHADALKHTKAKFYRKNLQRWNQRLRDSAEIFHGRVLLFDFGTMQERNVGPGMAELIIDPAEADFELDTSSWDPKLEQLSTVRLLRVLPRSQRFNEPLTMRLWLSTSWWWFGMSSISSDRQAIHLKGDRPTKTRDP